MVKLISQHLRQSASISVGLTIFSTCYYQTGSIQYSFRVRIVIPGYLKFDCKLEYDVAAEDYAFPIFERK